MGEKLSAKVDINVEAIEEIDQQIADLERRVTDLSDNEDTRAGKLEELAEKVAIHERSIEVALECREGLRHRIRRLEKAFDKHFTDAETHSFDPAPEEYKAYYKCAKCGEELIPENVTYDETHDGDCGGTAVLIDPAPDMLATDFLHHAHKYWTWYNENKKQDAVVWLRNDETGEVGVYTRGEYGEDLVRFVETIDSSPAPEAPESAWYEAQKSQIARLKAQVKDYESGERAKIVRLEAEKERLGEAVGAISNRNEDLEAVISDAEYRYENMAKAVEKLKAENGALRDDMSDWQTDCGRQRQEISNLKADLKTAQAIIERHKNAMAKAATWSEDAFKILDALEGK